MRIMEDQVRMVLFLEKFCMQTVAVDEVAHTTLLSTVKDLEDKQNLVSESLPRPITPVPAVTALWERFRFWQEGKPKINFKGKFNLCLSRPWRKYFAFVSKSLSNGYQILESFGRSARERLSRDGLSRPRKNNMAQSSTSPYALCVRLSAPSPVPSVVISPVTNHFPKSVPKFLLGAPAWLQRKFRQKFPTKSQPGTPCKSFNSRSGSLSQSSRSSPTSISRNSSDHSSSKATGDINRCLYEQTQKELMDIFSRTTPPNKLDFMKLMIYANLAKDQIEHDERNSKEESVQFLKKFCFEKNPEGDEDFDSPHYRRQCNKYCTAVFGYALQAPEGYFSINILDVFACGTLISVTEGEVIVNSQHASENVEPGRVEVECDCKTNDDFSALMKEYEIDLSEFERLKKDDPVEAVWSLKKELEYTNIELLTDTDTRNMFNELLTMQKFDVDPETIDVMKYLREAGGHSEQKARWRYWQRLQKLPLFGRPIRRLNEGLAKKSNAVLPTRQKKPGK